MQEINTSFGEIASHYDLLMESVPYRMWVDYLILLWTYQDIRPKKVLDVCCGTGNMAELLEKKGYELTGFDLSEGMIEKANLKAKHNLSKNRYFVANATNFELGETFDAAYSFFDSLNYITTGEGLRAAIHQVAKHLKPGGSWVFDLNTRYAFDERMFDQQNLRKTAPLRYRWRSNWNPETLLIEVNMKFWVDGKEFVEVHRQRAHPEEEVRQYLAEAGFEQIRVFHSYSLDAPRATTDRVHYVAIRSA